MQPTFIPWTGYFNLISRADEFVFYDDVKYSRQSWQTRNRILLNGNAHWISLRVDKKSDSKLINKVRLSEGMEWREKLCRKLSQTYSNHPFPDALAPVIESLANTELRTLAELNIAVINRYISIFEFGTRVTRSSSLSITGSRGERLVSICRRMNCNQYLSPAGAREYLAEDNAFLGSNIEVEYQNFTPGPYSQKGSVEFVPQLCIVDVLANLGVKQTLQYIYSGEAK